MSFCYNIQMSFSFDSFSIKMLQLNEKNVFFKRTVSITIAPPKLWSLFWQKLFVDCCLTSLFSLFRVCVKKSSQERLALKILIDRPKARNEVRGNAAAVVAERCLLLVAAASYYHLLAIHPHSFFPVFSGSLRFDLCRVVFLRCASQLLRIISGHFCCSQAAYTPGRGAAKTDGHTLWTVKTVTGEQIITRKVIICWLHSALSPRSMLVLVSFGCFCKTRYIWNVTQFQQFLSPPSAVSVLFVYILSSVS